MTDTVKAKVADHHFKGNVNIGDVTLTKNQSREIEVNTTLRNMVDAGNVVITEGDLVSAEDEKSFQEDEPGGETGEEDDGENTEQQEPGEEEEETETSAEEDTEDLENLTVDELQELCEEQDLKKSGTKEELVERLQEE